MTDATLNLSPQFDPSVRGGARHTTRKRMTANDARVRTIRVKLTRILFLAGAMTAVLALVGSVLVRAIETAALPSADLVDGKNLVLDTPRFVGRTKSGGRVVVTAQKATRSLAQADGAVQLVKPVLETSDGSTATADNGIWSQEKQTLSLRGNVLLNRQGGDVAQSQTADWTSQPERLTMAGGVSLVRQNGDNATGENAVWDAEAALLTVLGNVNIARKSGERGSSNRAMWQSQQGVLALDGNVNLTLPSGESAFAQTVRFNEGDGTLLLQQGVVVRFAAGQANSTRAVFQSATGRLTGDGGVNITSDLGNGRADRYVYETRSKRLNLSGNAVATLKRQ
jgi:hypothetical protein